MERLSHYEILEKLGEGGMGVVYKARDTRLDRFVALKVISPDPKADPDRRHRFVLEAKAASALNHPGIVTVHEIAREGDVDFIVMEHVPGRTLDQLIPRDGMRVRDALACGVQIADALAAAHAAGIVHRDLKPANLMITEAGRVKVLDFGLAKLREHGPVSEDDPTERVKTKEGTILGTCAYMSPEQAEGRTVDPRSDIFSFGLVLYEMLTGQRAFRRDSKIATLAAILREDPAPPRERNEEVPPELERIVLRCLRKDPARRFQTMADLKVALAELKEESDSGKLAGGSRSPEGRRHRRMPGVALAAGVLALGAGVVLLRHSSRAGSRGEQVTPAVPLTSFAGRVFDPALSPDGNEVAFVWSGEKQASFDLYLKLVGPGTPIRLTNEPGRESSPAWSPDGRQIAFLRSGPSRSSLVVIPALGGPERTVVEAEGLGLGLAWSPDGQSLFVARGDAPGKPAGIFVVSVGAGTMRRLTTPPAEAWSGDISPALSPDGRTLAFARSLTRSNSNIYVVPLSEGLEATGEPRRLTFEERASGDPVFSQDGTKIIFSAGGRGSDSDTSLMVIPVSGSGEKAERVPGTDGGESATLSRQGRLVFLRWLRDENVWRLRPADGRPGVPERFIASTRKDIDPAFAADGRRLLFASDRSGMQEVWICEADGSNDVQLTSLPATMTSGGRWSPDGRMVVFVSNIEGQMELYLTTPNGTTPQRLTSNPAHDSAPRFSRDGKWCYFASNREDGFQIWKMPPEPGGAPVRVTRGGGYAAIESTDGRTLYYTKRRGEGSWSIWKVPVSGGEEVEMALKAGTWGDFDVTETGITYIDSALPGARLRFHRFADGSDTVLATLEKRPSFGVTVSPLDGTVLFTQFDVDANELMLVESFR